MFEVSKDNFGHKIFDRCNPVKSRNTLPFIGTILNLFALKNSGNPPLIFAENR